MTRCKNCSDLTSQCVMCHFQDVLDSHDRVEQTVLKVVPKHSVSEGGKVATTLADLTEKGVEYYLRPNGDIIKFIDGHFANELVPTLVDNHPVPGDDRETLIVSDTCAA